MLRRADALGDPARHCYHCYDELVSRMVHSGRMEAHDFNALLRGLAEEIQEPVRENLFDNKAPDLFGSH